VIEPLLSDETLLEDIESSVDSGRGALQLWWLGQSGYLIKHGPWRLLVDPYLSDTLTAKYSATNKPHVRMSRRVVDPAKLRDIMFVTASHAHTDHMDPATLAAIRQVNDGVAFIAPRAETRLAQERWGPIREGDPPMILMSDGECQGFVDLSIFAVPAAHDTLSRDADGNAKCQGYVFRFGEVMVYHSGDTVLYDGMVESLRSFGIDIAILPINGKVGNMNGREAAQLAKDIGAKVVIPCHYDMFEFNTADPADEFIPECERLRQAYRVLQQGERFSSAEIPGR